MHCSASRKHEPYFDQFAFIHFTTMHARTHNQTFDWLRRSLCLVLPFFGLLVLQQMPGSELTGMALSSGHWWTLWSGHLLHYTMDHFIWDAVMFVVFSSLLWPVERWRMWLWLVLAAPIISIFVFSVEPGLREYRGLSALDTMLCVRFFCGFLRSDTNWERWLLGALPLFGLSLKIGYEWMFGQTLFVSDLGEGIVPLVSAHFAGLVIGLVWGVLRVRLTGVALGVSARRISA